MRELKVYTGNAVKGRNERKYKGWSDKGKKFLVEMTQDIKDDVSTGRHGQWEKIYRRICNVVKESKEKENENSGRMQGNQYVVDYNVMYEEV